MILRTFWTRSTPSTSQDLDMESAAESLFPRPSKVFLFILLIKRLKTFWNKQVVVSRKPRFSIFFWQISIRNLVSVVIRLEIKKYLSLRHKKNEAFWKSRKIEQNIQIIRIWSKTGLKLKENNNTTVTNFYFFKLANILFFIPKIEILYKIITNYKVITVVVLLYRLI